MRSLTTLLAAADESAVERLRKLLARHTDFQIVSECRDGFQAVDRLARLRPEVAFLEVDLPGLDAFSVCEQIGDIRPHLVFISAAAADAVRAFELPALDCILKPYSDERLHLSVDRLRRAAATTTAMPAEELRSLLRLMRGTKPEQLAVRSRKNILLVPLNEIHWIEAEHKLVRIHSSRRNYTVRGSLVDVEGRLPTDQFMRVHREAIVNLGMVQQLVPWLRGELRLMLHDGTLVPLGRRYRKEFEASLRLGQSRIGS